MDENKKKTTDTRKTEIEKVDINEVEHQTTHPGQAEFSLQSDTFAPAENSDLNEYPNTDQS
ncbi:hypothetical protein [Salibacterium aidingense]|uniref:hypothetical protein n=1 Tax=Salibacterium aidingense TaxID=384933 RepID=UPI0003F6451D|nr:hypothetical protein [Salibacterium aidingense]